MTEQNRDNSSLKASEQLFRVIVTANAVFERQIKFVARQQLHETLRCDALAARKVFVVHAAAEAVDFNSGVNDGLHNVLPVAGAFAVLCNPRSMNGSMALFKWQRRLEEPLLVLNCVHQIFGVPKIRVNHIRIELIAHVKIEPRTSAAANCLFMLGRLQVECKLRSNSKVRR